MHPSFLHFSSSVECSKELRSSLKLSLKPNVVDLTAWCSCVQSLLANSSSRNVVCIVDHAGALGADASTVLDSEIPKWTSGSETTNESFMSRIFGRRDASGMQLVPFEACAEYRNATYGDFLIALLSSIPHSLLTTSEQQEKWLGASALLMGRHLPSHFSHGEVLHAVTRRCIKILCDAKPKMKIIGDIRSFFCLAFSGIEGPCRSSWTATMVAALCQAINETLRTPPQGSFLGIALSAPEERQAVECFELLLLVMTQGLPFFRRRSSELPSTFSSDLVVAIARGNASPMMDVHNKSFALTSHLLERLPTVLSADKGDLLLIVVNVLESRNAAAGHRNSAVDVLRSLFREPQNIVDVFVNYDLNSDTTVKTSFATIVSRVCSVAVDSATERVLVTDCVDCLRMASNAFMMWVDRFDAVDEPSTNPAPDMAVSPTTGTEKLQLDYNMETALQRKKKVVRCIAAFNSGNIDVARGVLEELADPSQDKSEALGDLLFDHESEFQRHALGIFFSRPSNIPVLRQYVKRHDFTEMTIDEALRIFLGGFQLVGEAQVVDRTMELFAQAYCEQNPVAFSSAATAMVLSFSICMLNTDLHSPHVSSKMSVETFIKSNRGVNDGTDLPDALLQQIYQRIAANEIKLRGVPDAKANATSFVSGIPVLRRLIPLLSTIITAPIDVAGSAVGLTQERQKRRQEEMLREEMNGVLSQVTSARTHNMWRSGIQGLDRLLPILQSCVSDLQRTFVALILQDVDDKIFELCCQGSQQLVGACCDVGLVNDVLPHVAAISSFLESARFVSLGDDGGISEMGPALTSRRGMIMSLFVDLMCRNCETIVDVALTERLVDLFAIICVYGYGSDDSGSAVEASKGTSSKFLGLFGGAKPLPATDRRKSNRDALIAAGVVRKLSEAFDATGRLSTLPHVIEALCNVTECHTLRGRPALLAVLTAFILRCVSTSRLTFSRIWMFASHAFQAAGTHTDTNTVEFAVDGIRQIAFALLPLEELSQFHFQRDVLKPLEVAAMHNPVARSLVLAAIQDVVETRAKELTSAWPIVLSILSHAASFPGELPSRSWSILESILLRQTTHVGLDSVSRLEAIMRCLINFSCAHHEPTALAALASCGWMADRICFSNTGVDVPRDFSIVGARGTVPDLSTERVRLLDDLLRNLSAIAMHPVSSETTRVTAIETMLTIAGRFDNVVEISVILVQCASKLAKPGTEGRQVSLLCLAVLLEGARKYQSNYNAESGWNLVIGIAIAALESSKRDTAVVLIVCDVCDQLLPEAARDTPWDHASSCFESAVPFFPPATITVDRSSVQKQTAFSSGADAVLHIVEAATGLRTPDTARDFALLRLMAKVATLGCSAEPRLDKLLDELSAIYLDQNLRLNFFLAADDTATIALLICLLTTSFFVACHWGRRTFVAERLSFALAIVGSTKDDAWRTVVWTGIAFAFRICPPCFWTGHDEERRKVAEMAVECIRKKPSSAEETAGRNAIFHSKIAASVPTVANAVADFVASLLCVTPSK